jgi:hypothetical protein
MPKTVVAYYAISNFGFFRKNVYVVHGMLHAARNIGSMQRQHWWHALF